MSYPGFAGMPAIEDVDAVGQQYIAGFGAYFVFFGINGAGVEPSRVVLASGIAAGVSILARFVWLRWLTERNEVLMLTLASAGTALALLLLAGSPALGEFGFWLATVAVGGTLLAVLPVHHVVLIRNTNPRYIGRVGSIIGFATSISLAGWPWLLAAVLDTVGLTGIWIISAATTAAGTLTIAVFGVITRRRARTIA